MEAQVVDYSVAGEYAQWVRALAIVESNEQPGKIGDGGRAFGILQQHPAFFAEYGLTVDEFAIKLSDDWNTAQIKAAARFFLVWEHLGLDKIVQAYNKGPTAIINGDRALDYLQRFHNALNSIRGGK